LPEKWRQQVEFHNNSTGKVYALFTDFIEVFRQTIATQTTLKTGQAFKTTLFEKR
jgi:hypothetical protein